MFDSFVQNSHQIELRAHHGRQTKSITTKTTKNRTYTHTRININRINDCTMKMKMKIKIKMPNNENSCGGQKVCNEKNHSS